MTAVFADRMPAEDRVAELMPSELPGRRHDPAHPQRRADLLEMAGAVESRADHFLQRDDVGIDGREDVGDALGSRPAVEAPGAMDVVRRHAQVDPRPGHARYGTCRSEPNTKSFARAAGRRS